MSLFLFHRGISEKIKIDGHLNKQRVLWGGLFRRWRPFFYFRFLLQGQTDAADW